MLRILTDRGTEYCGRVEQHDYQLYLAINDIDHTKTKAMSPQTNGICERFHKTILNEFNQVTFRKKLYGSMEELQKDLDEWMDYYNNHRTHQGKMCCGRTPIECKPPLISCAHNSRCRLVHSLLNIPMASDR